MLRLPQVGLRFMHPWAGGGGSAKRHSWIDVCECPKAVTCSKPRVLPGGRDRIGLDQTGNDKMLRVLHVESQLAMLGWLQACGNLRAAGASCMRELQAQRTCTAPLWSDFV